MKDESCEKANLEKALDDIFQDYWKENGEELNQKKKQEEEKLEQISSKSK